MQMMLDEPLEKMKEENAKRNDVYFQMKGEPSANIKVTDDFQDHFFGSATVPGFTFSGSNI